VLWLARLSEKTIKTRFEKPESSTVQSLSTASFPGRAERARILKKHAAKDDQGNELGEIDPTRPMASWRTARRSILKEAGIKARFHDLRHRAVTQLAKAGLPDHVIMGASWTRRSLNGEALLPFPPAALNQAAPALPPLSRRELDDALAPTADIYPAIQQSAIWALARSRLKRKLSLLPCFQT